MKNTLKEVDIMFNHVAKELNKDSNIALIRLRQTLEIILNYLQEYNQLPSNSFSENISIQIEELYSQNIITKKEQNLFHSIRKLGNKAAHERYFNYDMSYYLYGELRSYYDAVLKTEFDSTSREKYKTFPREKGDSTLIYIYNSLLNYCEALNDVDLKSVNTVENNQNNTASPDGPLFTISISSHQSVVDYNINLNIFDTKVEIKTDSFIDLIPNYNVLHYYYLVNHMNSKINLTTFIMINQKINIKATLPFEQIKSIDTYINDVINRQISLVAAGNEFFKQDRLYNEGTL